MDFKQIDSFSNRMKIAMRKAGKKQTDLVRETGIDKGSMSHYVNGRYEPKHDIVFLLAKALDVSEMWLWGYDCEMERPNEQKANDSLTTIVEKMKTDKHFFETVNNLFKRSEEPKQQKETVNTKDGNRTMGDVIKSLRINRKLSLVECSEELGIPLSDLQKYENGNKQLTTNIVNDIARIFGLESADITDSFLYLEDNSPKNSFRREYVNNIRIWNEEFGQDTFTQEEIQELFKYGRYLRWKRDN